MQTRGRRYTGSANGQEVPPELKALEGIEIYTRGLLDEVKSELEALDGVELDEKQKLEKIELLASKRAYKEVLQYIKESRDK